MPEKTSEASERDGGRGGRSLRPFWSGTLAFGLVSVPVDIYPANRRERISLRMLSPHGVPLERRYWCPVDEREVSRDEIVRGYRVGPEEYVVVSDEELAALAPEKSREIDLRRFVPVDEIDPSIFERAYFLTPAGDSTKAYRLLAQVMEESDRAGIATFVMRGKEYLVAILSEGGILRAETLRFADELRGGKEIGLSAEPPEVAKTAVSRYRKAIRALAEDELDRSELTDAYAERFEALLAKKRKKGETPVEVEPEAEPPERAPDLMNVLKFSLERAERANRPDEGGESGGADRAALEAQTKTELYERAQELDLPGRSSMSKDELVAALLEAGETRKSA